MLWQGVIREPVPQMNMSLERARFVDATVGRPSLLRPDLQLVRPGEPDRSYLVMKVEGALGIAGARMPLGRDPLLPADIQLIREWISAGALENQGTLDEREEWGGVATSLKMPEAS